MPAGPLFVRQLKDATLQDIISRTLEELEVGLREKYGDSLYYVLNQALDVLGSQYLGMYNGGAPPDYCPDAIRFCYVYKYVACNAFSTYSLLECAQRKLFKQTDIRIACLGGGPGSDAIGVLEYLCAQESIRKVTIDIWDANEEWMATADVLIGNAWGHSAHIEKEFRYMIFDAHEPSTWGAIEFPNYDLVMSSYFLSEIGKSKPSPSIVEFWNKLLDDMKPGAIFGLVDNNNHSPEQIWNIVEGHPRQFDVLAKGGCTLTYPEADWIELKRRYEGRLAHSPRRRPKVAAFLLQAQ